MGVGAGLSMYVVVVQKFTFAISSPDEFLLHMTREFRRFANTVGRNWHIYVCMDFRTFWPKMGVFLAQNREKSGVMLTHDELVLTLGGCYLCVTFGENRS